MKKTILNLEGRIHKSEKVEKRFESLFTQRSKEKRVSLTRQPMYSCSYKGDYFITNTNPLPSVVDSFLQETKVISSKEVTQVLPPIRELELQVDHLPSVGGSKTCDWLVRPNGLHNAPTLYSPNFTNSFEIGCDASIENGKLGFYIHEKELYSFVKSLQTHSCYNLSKELVVPIDREP